jgi:hypothetical protein
MSEAERLMRAYIDALSSGNTGAMVELFAPSGTVNSPLYGIRPAVDFFQELAQDTSRSTLELESLYTAPHDPDKGAVHFRYRWELKNGEIVTFSCVDLFECTGRPPKILRLSIVYDTHPLRAAFCRQRPSANVSSGRQEQDQRREPE